MLLGGSQVREGRWLGEPDSCRLGMEGRRGRNVLLQELLIESIIFGEEMLVLVGGLRTRHFILLRICSAGGMGGKIGWGFRLDGEIRIGSR